MLYWLLDTEWECFSARLARCLWAAFCSVGRSRCCWIVGVDVQPCAVKQQKDQWMVLIMWLISICFPATFICHMSPVIPPNWHKPLPPFMELCLNSSRPEHYYPHQKSLELWQLLCVRWFYSKHHRKNKSVGYGEYLHKANSLCSNLYDNYCLNVSCYHSNGCVFNEGNESDMKTLINFTSREIYQPFTVITPLTPISCLQKGESTVNMKLQSGFCGDTTWLICSSVSIFEAGTPKSIQIHQNGDGMGASWRG